MISYSLHLSVISIKKLSSCSVEWNVDLCCKYESDFK